MKKGISLIVLVITIIVIIILAGAVILSLANNNPIAQATTAVYKQDKVAVQSAVNMYLARVMAEKQAAATITAGDLNGGGTLATYTVGSDTPANFTFGTGNGTVGIALPSYTGSTTVWSIDSNGVVGLTINSVAIY